MDLWYIIIGGLSFLLWLPFWNVPYYTDTAAIAYLADNMKRGRLPYRDFFSYSPIITLGLYYLARKFYPYDKLALYLFNMVWQTLGALAAAAIGVKLGGTYAGICSGVIYILLSTSINIESPICNFEALTIPPLAISFLLLIDRPYDHWSLFLAGIALSVSSLIKQVSAIYLIPFLILTHISSGFSNAIIFLSGFFVLHILLLDYFLLRNGLVAYLVDNWLYFLPGFWKSPKEAKYSPTTQKGISHNWGEIWRKIRRNSATLLPWLLLTPGGLILGIYSENSFLWVVILISLCFSLYLLSVRGTFWPHYWQNLILWIALCAGMGAGLLITETNFKVPTIGAITCWMVFLVSLYPMIKNDLIGYKFQRDPFAHLRRRYGSQISERTANRFQIAEYLKKISRNDDKALVLGWAPEILCQAQRQSFLLDNAFEPPEYIFNLYRNETWILRNDFAVVPIKAIREHPQGRILNPFATQQPDFIVFIDGEDKNIKYFEKLGNRRFQAIHRVGENILYQKIPEEKLEFPPQPLSTLENRQKTLDLLVKKPELFSELLKMELNDEELKEFLLQCYDLILEQPAPSRFISALGESLIQVGALEPGGKIRKAVENFVNS